MVLVSYDSEVVVLEVEVGDGVLEFFGCPLYELVGVVGEGCELLVDVLEGLKLLDSECELLGFVSLEDGFREDHDR